MPPYDDRLFVRRPRSRGSSSAIRSARRRRGRADVDRFGADATLLKEAIQSE